ncbi:MAG TPA: hypothetical protein VIO58_15410 [Candidatus Methanoperedens sp.]
MKLTWKVSVLFALISFGIGFITGWHPTFEGVRSFVIGGLSLGLVVEVVGILREIFKEHREERAKKREKLEGYIHEHNKKLVDVYIKPWYEDKTLSYANEPFAIEHLQIGYSDILKLRQEYVALNNEVAKEEHRIKEYIKNKLAPHVPQFGFSRDFTVENIEQIIYDTIKDFSKKGVIPDNYIANLSLFGYRVVEDNNEKYLMDKKETFRRGIESIIKDKIPYDMFERITKNRTASNKKIHEFYQGLKQIVHDFDERHIELEGTCKDCKEWHDELKSLRL